jgi:hypothetical protein
MVHILCFVDCTSRYIRVMKTNLMHYLSSVYFVNQPLHVSDIFVAHHQEVYCIQGVAGGKDNILGGHRIGHSKQKTLYEHVSYSERFPR